VPKDVQAKLQYCNVCHGASAQGFLGYYPIPRLAGQQVAYIENQLKGFVEQKRTSNIMFNVGHVLTSDDHRLGHEPPRPQSQAARRRPEGARGAG
jgi:cytochrome c553